MSRAPEAKAPNRTVLLCEDEAIVAMDLQFMLEDLGFDVIGPFADMKSAKAALNDTMPDIAVLDVNLRDGHVFPLADMLMDKGVRLIFHSGHVDGPEINRRYPDAETCMKPIDPARLKTVLPATPA
jgi:two-component SAPR family response regulator